MSSPNPRTFHDSLRALFNSGVRYSTVIDIGCADGHFFLTLLANGIVTDAKPLNIDINPLYADSLKAISEVVSGTYRNCAITDHEGEVEFTNSAHPYWSSLRPKDDPYWHRINDLANKTILVPARRLDALCEELALQAPFLLKLDVQGAEAAVLRGAAETLKNTHVVICEADMDDFERLNAILIANDFVLYDLTSLSYVGAGHLGWFYPVYVHRSLDFVRPKTLWDVKDNDAAIQAQRERRDAVLKWNAETLAAIRKAKGPARPPASADPATVEIGRNKPCPCGSGKRFKHCHGLLT